MIITPILARLIVFFATPPSGCESSFFGLISWFHYLPSSDFSPQGNQTALSRCDINNNFNLLHGDSVILVLMAIVDDLLRIAGIVAVAFVMYGAVQFTTSQGNAEQAAKARNTVINSLIGLAISVTAIVLVGFIGNSL